MAKHMRGKTMSRSVSSSGAAIPLSRTRKRQPAEHGNNEEPDWVTRVYVWGSNHNGQVSTRLPTRPCAQPFAVAELDATQRSVRKAIASIACGHDATFVVSVSGAVYSWGKGPIGRKGNSNKIARVPSLPAIRQIAVGMEHVVACGMDGSVLTWGKAKGGRLGHGNASSVATPKLVEALAGEPCVAVAVGEQHSIVLTEAGDLFAFGSARAGQLGHGTTLDSMVPVLVPRSDPVDPWSAMACGANHSIACTTSGKLYGWGWSSDGRLGFNPGEEEDEGTIVSQPRRVLLPPGIDIRSVGCGHAHTLCVSSRGRLYAFGWNAHGQCGVNPQQAESVVSPVEVPLPEHVVLNAVGGFAHSMVTTQQKQLLVWGFGLEGQLGSGNEESSYVPSAISLGNRSGHILSVSLGHCHSGAIVSMASLETLSSMYKANTAQRKAAAQTIAEFVAAHWRMILLQRKLAAEVVITPAVEPPRAPAPRGLLIDDGDIADDSKFFVTNLPSNI